MKYLKFFNETVLYSSNELIEILKRMNDKISDTLLLLINNDIETKYNLLDITDNNKNISFMNDKKFISLLNDNELSDLFNTKNSVTSIGRIVRSILDSNNINYTDQEMEQFVNSYKSAWDIIHNKSNSIRIIEGEDIKKWYNVSSYAGGGGSLQNSCMRYNKCQPFFEIYSDNPNVVKMLIHTDIINDKEKLLSRALIWETDEGKYLDRLYTTKDSDNILINNWVNENLGNIERYNDTKWKNLKVKLDITPYIDKGLPYMDTFMYYYDGYLYNKIPYNTKDGIYILQYTDGSVEFQRTIYSTLDQTTYFENDLFSDNIFYIPSKNDYSSRILFCDILNEIIFKNDAISIYDENDHTSIEDYIAPEHVDKLIKDKVIEYNEDINKYTFTKK